MNDRRYRLVFSRRRGMLVAMEETARGAGKAGQGETAAMSSVSGSARGSASRSAARAPARSAATAM
ncbi:ESPR-type extended signal peptide-containing protein [Pararobbsia alpina]|uniref:ESPR-type extended signal peptide-containing protein n=1 Tax=Pararobbsia alpina TaxID=621374 RepID=UPI0015817D46